jgi:predicted RNase H-like nuclease (RuvC/YqgF family)
MALAQEDIEQIRLLIQKTLSEMPETLNANVRYELDLRERTIRVEEELKHQRELMLEGFKQMEKRFEQVDKRFEQVDKRFEQVDKRFEQMQLNMDKRFEQMDKRFEQIDKRFEQTDKKFEQLHQEVMGLHHEIKLLMRWSFGTLLAIGGLIVAVLRLTP